MLELDVTPKPAIAAPELIGFLNNPSKEFRPLGKPINTATVGIQSHVSIWLVDALAAKYTIVGLCE